MVFKERFSFYTEIIAFQAQLVGYRRETECQRALPTEADSEKLNE